MDARKEKKESLNPRSVRVAQSHGTVPSYLVCSQIAALAFLSQIACSTKSADAPPPSPVDAPIAAPMRPADATAVADLRAQLQQVTQTSQQMKAVLDEVPAQKEMADALRARLERIRARVGNEELENVLKRQRGQGLDTAADPAKGQVPRWTERARALDKQLSALPSAPSIRPEDSAEVKSLKTELQKETHALKALQAATQLAFRALSAIDGLERSVDALEKAFPTP